MGKKKQGRSFITPLHINTVKALHAEGVAIREIARRMGIAPSTAFRIIHGITTASKRYKRCPQCGALIRTKTCRYCEVRPSFNPPEDESETNAEIQLDLREREQKRYEQVRKKADARYARHVAQNEFKSNGFRH